jgi:hypothetical protein
MLVCMLAGATRLFGILLLLGVASVALGCTSVEAPVDPDAPVATLWLDDEGRAHVEGRRFELDDSDSDAELIAWLRKWLAGHPEETLLMGVQRGTDGAFLSALADRLEEAGIDDWRMNLSASPPQR